MSTYNKTLSQIINRAFTHLGIIAPGDTVEGDDYALAVDCLNTLLNEWQTPQYGLHMWLYDEVTLFLNNGQQYYIIGGEDSDRVATNVRQTFISGDVDVLETIIGVTSTYQMNVGDTIGITLNNGTIQWTTITQIVDDIIQIADELDDYASQNNPVWAYQPNLDEVFEIDNVRLVTSYNSTSSINTIKLYPLSREEFFRIPNVGSQVSPIQYFVDRRESYMRLWLYGTGTTSGQFLQFTAKRNISSITNPGSEMDLPKGWLNALIYNLCIELADVYEKEFKVANPNSLAVIAAKAARSLKALQDYDLEPASCFFQPDLQDYN